MARINDGAGWPEGKNTIDPKAIFEILSREVRGQAQPLSVLSDSIARHLSKKNSLNPAIYCAVGPVRTGKTLTGDTLHPVLAGLEPSVSFLRLHMCDFRQWSQASALFRLTHDLEGHSESTPFLNAAMPRARALIVFDDIEYAHPDLLLLLMAAINAGRLTFRSLNPNCSIDHRKAVFFLTTTHQSTPILAEIEKREAVGPIPQEEINEICRAQFVSPKFPPNIVARIREFLVFRPNWRRREEV